MKKKYIVLVLIFIILTIVIKIIYKDDWVVYLNNNQGFKIKFPADWKNDIVLDDISNSPHSFRGSFGLDNLYMFIEVNLPGEITPVLPEGPMCNTQRLTKIISSDIPTEVFSSTNSKNENNSCTVNLLDQHSVNTRFCVDSTGKAYPATAEKGVGEYFLACKTPTDTVFDIGLLCNGQEWYGIGGQKDCNNLFNKIISTFDVVNK